mmetsp:Transcript_17861/g.40856  ORF Transcript_17861/g.40856 Transcript_17861/m.40856 type:complete len:381 (-) Transcript_17861:261-1403(-)|eukprot:CAMPEP_0201123834 /NCGR_PEP_ID=MMETSP0850-20130426/9117_1 /ASSEMBLY_ACC=CAM_ASM_000622 /TAXON_ID=183588 /ORGANISM="Pseudo-nitzschia fraudulenta, Strain WWA7" /LENGTH=380 /DNA_ID=CAMNT_0047390923 /DNA_START=79 /DNA_END=1221 /DNA_ORIENTATION=-
MTDAETPTEKKDNSQLFGFAAAAFLLWAIIVTALLVNERKDSEESPVKSTAESGLDMMTSKTSLEAPNVCYKSKIDLPNIECMIDALDDGADVTEVQVGPQAGGNVTKGYNGGLEVDVVPITSPYYQKGLCPVNVHWHLGTEHYSAGEYDCESHDDEHRELMEEHMCGPSEIHERRKLAGKARQGYQCNLYDAEDEKYTKPYEWKYCDKSMEVGQTYEVHWPHSSAGACGTPNQYQTPFYDGVFCNLPMEILATLTQQNIADNVGVQAQVFVIVNDESYYYPDLIKGMIVEPDLEMGSDMAVYTGSTTGTSRNNTVCSSYTPITWQVDRKCHPISASSFDKMCADMMEQRDDMTDDLYAHGSRMLVADHLTANNHANLRA